MADRIIKNLRGVGLMAEDQTIDNLTPQGSVVTSSSFSQLGARPGQASTTDVNAKLEPQISGGQSVGVEVEVVRAGLPERGALGLVWRLDSDITDDAWRGRPPPNFLNGWVGAVWSDAEEYNFFDLVVIPTTQELILLYVHSGPGVVNEKGHAKQFDFALAEPAWGPEIDVTEDPNSVLAGQATYDSVCGVALPNDRVVSYWQKNRTVVAYFSDDAGATWDTYALPALDVVTGAVDRMRAVFYRGDVALFTGIDDAGEGAAYQTIRQFGSNSLGTKFIEVSECDDCGTSVSAVAIPGNGGIAVAYSNFADDFPAVRILSSCFDPINEATEIVLESLAVEDMIVTVDGTGTLWVTARITGGDANNVWVWFSIDGGASWDRIKPEASDGFGLHVTHDTNTRIRNFAGTWCRGWQVMAHQWAANPGNEGDSIGTMWSSGWSSLTTGGEDLDSMFLRRIAWAADSGSPAIGSTGIPIELPNDTIWNNSGTLGTLEAPGELEFAVVALNGHVLLNPASPAGGDDLGFFFEGKITAGTGSSTSLAAGFEMEVGDGVENYQVEFRFDAANSRIRVFDIHGASTIIDIAIDVSEFVQLAVGIDGSNGEIRFVYRRSFMTHWIDATPGLTLLTDGGALGSVNIIRFGSIAAPSTVTMRCRQWHHFDLEFTKPQTTAGLEIGLQAGARIQAGGSVNTLPIAVPEIGTATASAFIAAERGPGRDQDNFTIDPFFDFGIDRIFPTVSPSPSDPWRSDNDLTEQIIAWDFGESTRLGQVWLLFAGLFGVNFKRAIIEGGDGVTWSTLALYNGATGFEGLTYELTGDTMRPTVGTADAARFLDRNALRGGFVVLDPGGTPKPRKILRNSAGGWTDPTINTTLLPEIRLDGLDGSEPTSGTCDIVFPSGVTFHAYPSTPPPPAQYFRYWRLRIPVQDVPDPYFQIGNFVLGSVTVFGKQNSRGWSQTMDPNVSRRTSRFGTIRKRTNGPPARRWSMGWADGVFLGRLRAAGVDQPYLAVEPGGAAVAAVDDVWTLLWGLLEETGGGTEAIVALNTIPGGDTTITDRLRFLFGTWDSGVQFNQVVGDEDVNEFGRIDPIRVSELL